MKLNFNTVSGSYKLQLEKISPCFNKLNSKNTLIVEECKTKKITFRNLKKSNYFDGFFDMMKNDI